LFPRSLPLCVVAIFIAGFVPAALAQTSAQQATCDKYHLTRRCTELVTEFSSTHALIDSGTSNMDDPSSSNRTFAAEIGPRAGKQIAASDLKAMLKQDAQVAMQSVSTSAAVTQTGASATGTGSTNLVSKPTTTDLISMAAESGAFTDTINGTTATIQANALGIAKYIANVPIFEKWENAAGESGLPDAIQPLNFNVTLNIAQSSSSPVATSGGANSVTPSSIGSILIPSNNASLSSFGVTYNLYRPYNPQDKRFLAAWAKAVLANAPAAQAATIQIGDAINLLVPGTTFGSDDLPTDPDVKKALLAWRAAGLAAEQKPYFDDFVAAYAAYDNVFCDYVMKQADAVKNVENLVHVLGVFQEAVYAMVNQARGTPLATIGYTYSAPVQKPATHDASAVISELFRGGKTKLPNSTCTTIDTDTCRTFMSGAQLTGNFAASIYSTVPAGAAYGRFRDVQLSAEFDKPFGGTVAVPRGTFSVAGYGQYQYDPTVLNITSANLAPGTNITLPANAQVLLGTAGWLGVIQGKLVISLSQGLKVPLAIKWSNKTDLLQANDVRGQIGLSYDLSALSSLISGNK
jgi:hypothetical protein